MLRTLLFVLVSLLASIMSTSALSASRGTHLIVLVHGLMGSPRDLEYLGDRLTEGGCVVLKSASNTNVNSLDGIRVGAERLVEEIRNISSENPQIGECTLTI